MWCWTTLSQCLQISPTPSQPLHTPLHAHAAALEYLPVLTIVSLMKTECATDRIPESRPSASSPEMTPSHLGVWPSQITDCIAQVPSESTRSENYRPDCHMSDHRGLFIKIVFPQSYFCRILSLWKWLVKDQWYLDPDARPEYHVAWTSRVSQCKRLSENSPELSKKYIFLLYLQKKGRK